MLHTKPLNLVVHFVWEQAFVEVEFENISYGIFHTTGVKLSLPY